MRGSARRTRLNHAYPTYPGSPCADQIVKTRRTVTPGIRTLKCLIQLLFPDFRRVTTDWKSFKKDVKTITELLGLYRGKDVH